ncbi:hypothetical protein JYT25_00635 [bacterium AH-315-C20]|nr:hypothetical protein [bacterium AH-315-C20]
MSRIKAAALEKEGPFVGILVLPPIPIQEQMKAEGKMPEGRHLRAIIDTGAESSSVSIKTLNELNLLSRNFRERISTDGKIQQPVYDVVIQIQFGADAPPVNFQLEVAGLNLDQFGIYALIGRDILRLCKLNYNGAEGKHKLEFLGDMTS